MSESSTDKEKIAAIMALARESIESLARLDCAMQAQIVPTADLAEAFRDRFLQVFHNCARAFADMQDIASATQKPAVRMDKVDVALDLLKRVMAAKDKDDDGVPGVLIGIIREDLGLD